MDRFNVSKGLQLVAGVDHQSYSGRDEVLLIADQKESVNALYMQARSTDDWLPDTHVATGIRYNKQTKAGGMTLWNLSARHNFNSRYYFRGNMGTAFRLPDAWQLFGNDPCCTQGNPELKGEDSFNINLAVGGELPNIGNGLTWELIGLHRSVDNLIGSSDGIRVNTDKKVTISGGEFVLSYAALNDWSVTADLTYTDAKASGSRQQIPDIPEFAAKGLLAYEPSGQPFGFSASLLYVGSVNSDIGGFFPDGSFAEHGRYSVVDLSGYYEFGQGDRHRLVARIENLLDDEYATSIRTAQSDQGQGYLYYNLGVARTFHLFYSSTC